MTKIIILSGSNVFTRAGHTRELAVKRRRVFAGIVAGV
jgi:hypothetical protein